MPREQIDGMKNLVNTIRRLGDLPQKCVTKAARAGANIALKDARRNAPVLTGELKRGLKLKGERRRVKGKKVYQVTFDAAKSDLFVKETKAGKRYYYPSSQEYGYRTRNGGWIPGYRYLSKSIDDNRSQISKKVVDVLKREIDKL